MALSKRGELDSYRKYIRRSLREVSVKTIEEGIMTGDLINVAEGDNLQRVDSEEFLFAIKERLTNHLNNN